MSRRNGKKGNRNNWLQKVDWADVVTFCLAAIALILAWRANNIAESEFRSNVIVFQSEDVGWTFDTSLEEYPYNMMGCIAKLRLTNLGNAADSIVSYDTTVHYNDSKSVFLGQSEAANNFAVNDPPRIGQLFTVSEELRGAIEIIDLKLAPEAAVPPPQPGPIIGGNIPSLEFPLKINGFESLDTNFLFIIGIQTTKDFNYIDTLGRPMVEDEPTDLPRIEFDVTFKLASGTTANGPKIKCISVG